MEYLMFHLNKHRILRRYPALLGEKKGWHFEGVSSTSVQHMCTLCAATTVETGDLSLRHLSTYPPSRCHDPNDIELDTMRRRHDGLS